MDSFINNSSLLGFTEDKSYTIQDLNFYWSQIKDCIMTAAMKHIPHYKTSFNRYYINSLQKTELHADLKRMNHIYHTLKSTKSTNISSTL